MHCRGLILLNHRTSIHFKKNCRLFLWSFEHIDQRMARLYQKLYIDSLVLFISGIHRHEAFVGHKGMKSREI